MADVLLFLASIALVLVVGARITIRQARAEKDADPDQLRFMQIERGEIR